LINATFGLAGYVLVVSGRSGLLLANNVVVAIVNVALGVYLIPRTGLLGAATAAIAGVSLLHTLVSIEVWLMYRVLPVGWATLKPVIAAGAMLAIELLVGRHVGPTAARIVLVIAAGLVTYLLALVVLGLPPEDRQLVGRLGDRARAWLGRDRAR